RTSICMMRPAIPSDAPTSSTARVRGTRLTTNRKAELLAGLPSRSASGETSETPTKRLVAARMTRATPISTPTHVRGGRTRAGALGVACAVSVTTAEARARSLRDLQDVVDHHLGRLDSAVHDVPGGRVEVDDVVILEGRGLVDDVVVEDLCGCCALFGGAGRGVAVDHPQRGGVVLQQE